MRVPRASASAPSSSKRCPTPPVFMPSSSRVLSVPCASGMLGSAEPAGTIARSRHMDTDTSGRRRMFRVAWATRSRHPPQWPRILRPHTLPVDVVKSVATLRTNRSGWCFSQGHLNTRPRRWIDRYSSHLQRLCALRWGPKSGSARDPAEGGARSCA
jgi:hypothetical protein